MSKQDAVNAASVFPNVSIITPQGTYPLPVVMVAIAGPESGFDPNNKGDYGLGGPNCDGSTSWGLWQIHNVHSAYLTKVTGSSDPCVWENWCFNPTNNAQAALAIIQGFSSPQTAVENSWYTTWHSGAYLQYLDQAQAAFSGSSQVTSPVVYQNTSSSTPISSTTVTRIEEYGLIAFLAIVAILAIRETIGVVRSI